MLGETISHYRILHHLGQGGMGAVYLAEDINLGRKVALKLMLPEIAAHEHRLKRFLREAKLSSSINHPNVVSFYEVGEDRGRHFLAMEYIEGLTLRARLQDGPLSVEEAVRIARQVAEALMAAHKAGVIHRDVKPENVMIAAGGHVKVLDFGLARRDLEATGSESSEDQATRTQLSMVGQPIGTVSYMSPEQLRGQTVDGRTDIFALGILLYEALAGRRPFEAKSSVGTIQRILTTPPDAIARFNYEVPADVERVIRKCLEKDPEWRYQSARELAIDLAAIERGSQSGTLIEAPGSGSASSGAAAPVPGPGRRRWLLGATVALAAILAALAFALLPAGGGRIDTLAVLPFTNASADPALDYVASSLPDAIQRNLARLPGLSLTSRGAVRSFNGDDPIAAGRQFGVEAVLTGRVGKARGLAAVDLELVSVRSSSALWSRRYERPESELQELEEAAARDLAKFLRPDLAAAPARPRMADSAAFALYLKGRHYFGKRSLDDLNAAARLFQEAIEKDPQLALAYAGLADTYAVMADQGLQPPVTLRRQARAAARRAIELDPLIAEAHTSYAVTAALDEYDWTEAERGFRRAIELDPTYAQAHSWFAVAVLAPLGRQDEALIEIDRAISLEPQNPVFRLVRSVILFSARRFEESARAAASAGEELPDALKIVQSQQIAESRLAQNRVEEAIQILEKASPDRGQMSHAARAALAHAYARSNRTPEALALDQQLENASKFEFVAPCARVPTQIALGRLDRAIELLEQCYECREATFVYIKVEPRYDKLRTRADFRKLVKLARLE
jgi:TolB-like protein/Tfp pilus assembly protein PilF/predicted Ser/Thr protein kinase